MLIVAVERGHAEERPPLRGVALVIGLAGTRGVTHIAPAGTALPVQARSLVEQVAM